MVTRRQQWRLLTIVWGTGFKEALICQLMVGPGYVETMGDRQIFFLKENVGGHLLFEVVGERLFVSVVFGFLHMGRL